jgi:hypothetical protein
MANELSHSGEVAIPRMANPDNRYRDREFAGRLTDHRFIIGWREQSTPGWKYMTIVYGNTQVAQRFKSGVCNLGRSTTPRTKPKPIDSRTAFR